MDRLKRCPFCGGKGIAHSERARAFITLLGIDIPYPDTRHVHIVKCYECDTKTGYYRDAEKARAAWNKRSDADRIICGGCLDDITNEVSMRVAEKGYNTSLTLEYKCDCGHVGKKNINIVQSPK